MAGCYVSGTGSCVPEKRLTNHDLEQIVDTSDEWIRQRTGIRERRIAADGESTSDLACEAARGALASSGVAPEDIGVVIVCTVTPDTLMPASAVHVQRRLGLERAAAFDLNAACTGFVYGVTVGTSLVNSGFCRHALVIGAEALSRFMNYEDRATCILFGDGAGAVVLSGGEGSASAEAEDSGSRVIDSQIFADGAGSGLLQLPAGGSALPASHETVDAHQHQLSMEGREVFKFATKALAELIEMAIARNGLESTDIDLIVPHQVNSRIIEAAVKRLEIPIERFFLNLSKYGNTSAASVPLALDEAVQEGRLKRGDLVLLAAFGAGLTWGYNLVRW